MKSNNNEKKLEIKLNLYAIEGFSIYVEEYETMYYAEKEKMCNSFELKLFNTLPREEKISFKSKSDELLINKVKQRILRSLDVWSYIKQDNIFLVAGADFYEVIYRYESEASKAILEAIKKEHVALTGNKMRDNG